MPSSNNNHISFCQRRNSFIGLRFGTKLEMKEAGKSSTISSLSHGVPSSNTHIPPLSSIQPWVLVYMKGSDLLPRGTKMDRVLVLLRSSSRVRPRSATSFVAGSYSFYTLRCLSFSISGHRTLSGITSPPTRSCLPPTETRPVEGWSLGWHLAKFGF